MVNYYGRSSFALFTWKYISSKSGYVHHPTATRIILSVCCLLTGAVILIKILSSLFYSSNNSFITNLTQHINNSGFFSKNNAVSLSMGALISSLYIFQIYGLSVTDDTNGVLRTVGIVSMVLFFGSIYKSYLSKKNYFFYFSILCLVVYYIILIWILSRLDCPKEGTKQNPFEHNCYIDVVNIPMTFIILGLLFAYVICMSILRVFSKKTDNCIGKLESLQKCIKRLDNKLTNKSNLPKINDKLRDVADLLKNLKLNNEDTDCYKSIMAIIIISIVIILSGFNILLWFIRPEIFITLLVIQRLWFGSSYETTSNGNSLKSSTTPAMPTSTFRRKSWDLIGMPLVRWAMYLSNIDGDVTHKILYGETNRKTFGSTKEENHIFKVLDTKFNYYRKKVTNINPDK